MWYVRVGGIVKTDFFFIGKKSFVIGIQVDA